jgi:hypothetical protein
MTRHSALADISRLAGYGRGYVFETDCIGSDERSRALHESAKVAAGRA